MGGGRCEEGGDGRAQLKACSRLTMDCLLETGFAVKPSWSRRDDFEGGAPEHALAWLTDPLLGKGKVHLGHSLNSRTQPLAAVWGFWAPSCNSDSMTISSRIWAQRRALELKEVEHTGQLIFFVFFNIGEGRDR